MRVVCDLAFALEDLEGFAQRAGDVGGAGGAGDQCGPGERDAVDDSFPADGFGPSIATSSDSDASTRCPGDEQADFLLRDGRIRQS